MQNFFKLSKQVQRANIAVHKLHKAHCKANAKNSTTAQQFAYANAHAKYNAAAQQCSMLHETYSTLLRISMQQHAAQHTVRTVTAIYLESSSVNCIDKYDYAHAIASVKSVYAQHKRTHYKKAKYKAIARAYVKLYYIAVRVAYLHTLLNAHAHAVCSRDARTLVLRIRTLHNTFIKVCAALYTYKCVNKVALGAVDEHATYNCEYCYADIINTLANFAIAAVHSA